jgi:hypothetical protein
MTAVTARFYVSEITLRKKFGNATVVLLPAYANGANAEWATATPSGKIELQVNAEGATKVFQEWLEQGPDLHITMQPVDEIEG